MLRKLLVLVLGAVALTAGAAAATAADQPEFDGCHGEGEPFTVFNAFWSELDRRYGVFPQRLRDRTWADVGRAACAAVSASMPDEALYETLLGMARQLDDGHTRIVAKELGRRDAAWVTGYAHGEQMAALAGNVETRYLGAPLRRGESDLFAWGRIGEIGYLSLAGFEALSESVEESDDRAAASRILARAVRDLAGVKGLVVDVRANEGGWDEVQLEVARWLGGGPRLAYTKARRAGPGHANLGPAEEVWVKDSAPGAYEGPLIVLTSGWTFSAAETFALAMRTRPETRLLGERTSGHFSDLEPGTLPNGWSFTFSAELYRAPDGDVYEALGVPVDVPLPFDAAAFEVGRDTMLEAALTLLRSDFASD